MKGFGVRRANIAQTDPRLFGECICRITGDNPLLTRNPDFAVIQFDITQRSTASISPVVVIIT
jgi:hypothetical protein